MQSGFGSTRYPHTCGNKQWKYIAKRIKDPITWISVKTSSVIHFNLCSAIIYSLYCVWEIINWWSATGLLIMHEYHCRQNWISRRQHSTRAPQIAIRALHHYNGHWWRRKKGNDYIRLRNNGQLYMKLSTDSWPSEHKSLCVIHQTIPRTWIGGKR